MAELLDRLHFTAQERCPCGYGFAYDPKGEFFTESNSPFVMRPDQWECAGTLLWRAHELSADEAARMLRTPHGRPISFTIGGIAEKPGQSTREPIMPANDPSPPESEA